jgi:molybdenum cofactor cytidylyltransferase
MIAAVLLAAGRAQRFGGPQKLVAPVPHEGETVPLVRLSVLGLIDAGIEKIVVVLGRDAQLVRACLDGLDVTCVVNSDFSAGMSGSLRIGVDGVMQRWPASSGVLIALGDQPLLHTGITEALLEEPVTCDGRSIVAPRFRGEVGNPVIFLRALVPELLLVTGDRGARGVVERDPTRVRYVDFDRDAPPDVDTVADLAGFARDPR